MTETTALTTRELILPDRQTITAKLQAIREFQTLIQSQMIEGHDFGKIPGTQSATLLKPGAEKLVKLLELDDQYDILSQVENWDKPFFAYTVRCRLVLIRAADVEVSQGLGECNSYEAKYRWRQGERVCPKCGKPTIIKGREEFGGGWLCWKTKGGCGQKYGDADERIIGQIVERIENEDIFSQVNTLLKMAKKRALVDAALSAGRLSDIFTQDMEDTEAAPPQPVVTRGRGPTRPQAPPPVPVGPIEYLDDEPGPGKHETVIEGESRPVATGTSARASAQQRAYVERLLSDVGLAYADLRETDELKTLPEWADLTVASVPLAVNWLLQEKKRQATV